MGGFQAKIKRDVWRREGDFDEKWGNGERGIGRNGGD
jgi:hypothetical protein